MINQIDWAAVRGIQTPENIKQLRKDPRGYPIPFFVGMNNGVPDFKFQDLRKLKESANRHLCHICGKKLYKDFHYFVSGPIGYKNQVSSDMAMHRDCAEYSLMVCPHIFYQKAQRKTEGFDHIHAQEKPEYMLLIKSSKYKMITDPQTNYPLIHYRAVSAEKYIYVDGVLEKEQP